MKEHKDEKVLAVYIWACHGICIDGTQGVVVNEYSPKSEFYKIFNAEKMIRALAGLYQNMFQISFFACCRELYSSKRHTNAVKGPYEEALKTITARKEEEKKAEAKGKDKEQAEETLRQKVTELEEKVERLQNNQDNS